MQLKIVGFPKLMLCWFLMHQSVDMNDWPDRCETAIAVVPVFLRFGGAMILNGALNNGTIDCGITPSLIVLIRRCSSVSY
jgi:hypothetical protein